LHQEVHNALVIAQFPRPKLGARKRGGPGEGTRGVVQVLHLLAVDCCVTGAGRQAKH